MNYSGVTPWLRLEREFHTFILVYWFRRNWVLETETRVTTGQAGVMEIADPFAQISNHHAIHIGQYVIIRLQRVYMCVCVLVWHFNRGLCSNDWRHSGFPRTSSRSSDGLTSEMQWSSRIKSRDMIILRGPWIGGYLWFGVCTCVNFLFL